jgi:HAD superfamily hydrolase (TIGR01490 family)
MPRSAAFFDLDNTLMKGSSLFYVARGLYARKVIRTRDLAKFAWRQAHFRFGGRERAGHIHSTRQDVLSGIEGRDAEQIKKVLAELVQHYLLPRVWPGTQEIAEAHVAAGQEVWLVTASPVEVATALADQLGFTGALGTVAEVEAGAYTGRLTGDLLHGQAKADAVRRLASERDLDLASSSAYSDSANDIPMLELVGHPYAVNPDARLREHAKLREWPVHDYRSGRKAAAIGIPAAAGTGALAGVLAALGARRRRRHASGPRDGG